MDLQEAMEKRTSVRHFDGARKAGRATIEQMIEAAILAPSWKNSQTARYHCVMSDAAIREFSEKCLPEFNRKNAENASALIVTTFVKNRSGFEKSGEPTNEAGNGWGFYDLGLHNGNLLLKAKDLGLDTLVMGLRDEKAIRELLNIDDSEIIVSVIAVGYATKRTEKPRRKEVGDIAKFY